MDDLRQLLHYEVPGLIFIIYFLMLSYPIYLAPPGQFEIYHFHFDNILLGFAGFMVVLALPMGFLLYQLYSNLEHKNFFENRKGLDIVSQILEKDSSLEREYKWWSNHNEPAERNEILDAFFYGQVRERDLIDLLERFLRFYHSRRVVGVYAPLAATLVTAIAALFFSAFAGNFAHIAVFSVIAIISLVFAYTLKFIWKTLDNMNWPWYCMFYTFIAGTPVFLISVFLVLQLNIPETAITIRVVVVSFLILAISLMAILPTRRNGVLRRWIDELEINILSSRKKEIVNTLHERAKFG